ncbi:outer membrane protein [Bernardetia litoralis DSM 6794]|uniref:Outer membrane protein n=1 Tax=Bernardetia litoralis (strain ATCC 23117 / DSM 6794 / NBRC 15988 / NCIMB 1366 / Fx l1 / Sio-4) TaxID=880071 RepID=I4AK07_BERLS|nr:BamA/TamA family outer membrane protein [Bernardetia litoralis]AFM04292.1 outer membrane protein [Bernardetia litoralis DSM 6794]
MKITIYKTFIVLLLAALFPFLAQAQNQSEINANTTKENVQDSTKLDSKGKKHETETFFEKLIDYVEFRNKADKQEDSTRFRSKFVISPVLSYKPETSWGFGIGAKWLFKFKNATQDTRTSNMPISALYTLKKQIVISSGYTVFFNHENWMLKGNIGYSNFPQQYYGIGNNTATKNEEIFEYNNILIEPLLLKRIVGNFFLGGGIRYNNIWKMEYDEDGLLEQEKPLGYDGSISAGLEIAATYDNRDNVLNALHGSLYEFRHAFYGKQLGGVPFDLTKVDLRHYFLLSKKREGVLALQGYGYFSDGRTPLGELAALGGSELMRGYYKGRFLENNMLAAQMEYRFSVFEPIGMVVFAGAGEVYHQVSDLRLNDIKVAYGAGLRLKIVKSENLNIRFDVAKGEKFNFYFGIAEAF